MRASVATVKVTEALAMDGCPLCALHLQAEQAFFSAFFREMIMDGRSQGELGKQGLCPHHLHLVMEAPDKLGAALALRTLLQAAMAAPDAPNDGCYACSCLERTDRQSAQIIGDYFTSAEGSAQFEPAIERFCLPHIAYLIRVNMPRWRERMGTAFSCSCREGARRKLREMTSELDWFVRKFDYRMAAEPWRGTEDIVQRAAEKLGGKAGCRVWPEARRNPH